MLLTGGRVQAVERGNGGLALISFLAAFVFGQSRPMGGEPQQRFALEFVARLDSDLLALLGAPSVLFGCWHGLGLARRVLHVECA